MSQSLNEFDWSVFAPEEPEEGPEDEYYRKQAEFCLAMGVTPEVYDAMNTRQVTAWINVYNARNK